METKEKEFLHDFTAGFFNTRSGTTIDIKNPKVEDIDITDIAHALSNICRFGGHTRTFYSVASHCVLVMKLAPYHIAKEALLHDAAEAYLGDVIKPLKHLLTDYEGIEDSFMQVIISKFGLDPEKLKQVKIYDQKALEIEYDAYVKGDTKNIEIVEAIYGNDDLDNNDRSRANISLNYHDYQKFLRAFELLFRN